MLLKYVSEGGSFELGGGDNPFINITKMNGFELPAPDYETVKYVGENGVTTTGKTDLPRTLTISGDLMGGQLEIMNVLKALYYPGELYCDFGQIKRKIACKCTNLEDIERHQNCGINGFTFQFQADYPYFNDFYDTQTNLARYVNHVSNSFVLPCVFTEKLNEGIAYNSGDKITYPVICLRGESDGSLTSATLTITNVTSGKSIKIEHSLQNGEEVTFDLNTRRIKSNISGNITKKITDDTVLHEFFLEKGENKLTFSSTDTYQLVKATISFNNIYIMAVR